MLRDTRLFYFLLNSSLPSPAISRLCIDSEAHGSRQGVMFCILLWAEKFGKKFPLFFVLPSADTFSEVAIFVLISFPSTEKKFRPSVESTPGCS